MKDFIMLWTDSFTDSFIIHCPFTSHPLAFYSRTPAYRGRCVLAVFLVGADTACFVQESPLSVCRVRTFLKSNNEKADVI